MYEGVKVRAQPLPLRVPTSPQQQAVQQQTQVNHVQVPILIQNSSQTTTTHPTSPAPELQSPILTTLLHKKNPGNPVQIDASNLTLDTKVCLFASRYSITESSPTFCNNLPPAA